MAADPRRTATHGTKVVSTVAVTSTAGQGMLLLAANANRISALIVNNGAQTVYLDVANTVSTTASVPLLTGASLTDNSSNDAWYGLAASTTGDIRVIEAS